MNILSVWVFGEHIYCSCIIVLYTIWFIMFWFMVIQALGMSLSVNIWYDSTRAARLFPLFLLWTESSKPSYTIGQKSDVRSRNNSLLFNFQFLCYVVHFQLWNPNYVFSEISVLQCMLKSLFRHLVIIIEGYW